jgi:ribonuclease G
MQSAFVDIGGERAAFLHVADIQGVRQNGGSARPIERLLTEGQNLTVQVVKEPIGTKGARLSTQISIAGRFLVYLPQESHIGISQRIEDEEERAHLREKLRQLLPPEDKGGYIIRTVAETASERELAADLDYLRRLWSGIQGQAATAAPLTLLYRDLDLALRVLRDFVHEETARVLVDSRETCRKMVEFGQDFTPNVAERVEHYRGERPLFDLYGVEDEIEKALARRVDLKSGGYLVIDQTEALTTIDVNTGGFVTGRSFDDTIFKTNLEAALVIARQLRLRNIGGIVIIDFIDMDTVEHRNAVLNELRKALARDRTHMTVNGFSELGLVEMTRKRTRESLAQVLCEPCPACGGRARLKTPQTVCYAILRDLLREARQFNSPEYRILASQPVIDLLLDEESQALALLADTIGKPVSLQVETAYHQEQYDIVLM